MGDAGWRAVLDTETTGLDATQAHIVEVGAVVLGHDLKEVASFSTLANPGPEALDRADPEAMRIHGIPMEEILAAPPAADAAKELRRFLDAYPGTLHAFPVSFDMNFLKRPPWNIRDDWGKCVQWGATEFMNKAGALERFSDGKPRWARLSAAAKFFGVAQEGAHRALTDARTAALVMAEILTRLREEDILDEVRLMWGEGS